MTFWTSVCSSAFVQGGGKIHGGENAFAAQTDIGKRLLRSAVFMVATTLNRRGMSERVVRHLGALARSPESGEYCAKARSMSARLISSMMSHSFPFATNRLLNGRCEGACVKHQFAA
jgi:hypothetical protein